MSKNENAVLEAAVSESAVKYKRAKTWRIALGQLNSGGSMCFYILMTYASYLANSGYGIITAVVGVILTGTRIFDSITDPIIAILIDKTRTKFGKIRIWMLGGWLMESLALIMMFVWASGKGHGVVLFIVLYLFYVIGYTMNNVAGQIIPPVMVNDPKQRPLVGVWSTVYNYFVPMILSMVVAMMILPKYNNEYTVEMLAVTAWVCIGISFVFVILACIGVSADDKPENFEGIKANKGEKVKLKDMWNCLKSNRPLQMYVIAAATDKLAQQTSSQSIVTTMLFGILIGNIQLGTMLTVITMLPSIVFAILGGKYAGKHGSKEATVTWTKACLVSAAVGILFCSFIDMKTITVEIIPTIIFGIIILCMNGSKMCVTTASNSMMADVIDFELARTGNYLPAVVTATYSFIDKLISSLGITVATLGVAIIGYTDSLPQPTDETTSAIKIMTFVLYFGLPIFGWICTLIAMKFSPLSKKTMEEAQAKIAAEKSKLEEQKA